MTTTKSTLKRIICVLSCCLVVVFSFAVPVSAVIDSPPVTFKFSIPDPSLNFDGYIIMPETSENATIIAWKITPQSVYSDEITKFDIDVNAHVEEHLLTLEFINTSPNDSYLVSCFYIPNGEAEYIRFLNTKLVGYGDPYIVTLKENATSFICPNYFKGITRLTHTEYDNYYPANSFPYDCIFSDNTTEFNKLDDILNHFTSLLVKTDFTNEQLESMLEYYQLILDSCYNMEYSLDLFVNFYWEQFQMNDFPIAMNDISLKLQKIYNLLNKSGEVEQTTVDSSHVDNYLDIEQSLVNNDEAESALNDFDISIEGASYSFIWDFITNIFNSHPEVFGLVITILTLGIIALLLNR